MSAIIKTWPSKFTREKVLAVFNHPWARFYFTLGRGRPARPIQQLYYTHQGEILGHFDIREIVRNDGSLPKLHSITNVESEWQIRRDAWVAICPQPFHPLADAVMQAKLYHAGFRGWRYFDLEAYRKTDEAMICI